MQEQGCRRLTLPRLLEDEVDEGRKVLFHEVIQREIPVLGVRRRELPVAIRVSIATPVQQPDVVPARTATTSGKREREKWIERVLRRRIPFTVDRR